MDQLLIMYACILCGLTDLIYFMMMILSGIVYIQDHVICCGRYNGADRSLY